jgi:hypothetical protein
MDKIIVSAMARCERTKCNVRVNSRYLLESGIRRTFCTEQCFVEQVAKEKTNVAKRLVTSTSNVSSIQMVEDLLKGI